MFGMATAIENGLWPETEEGDVCFRAWAVKLFGRWAYFNLDGTMQDGSPAILVGYAKLDEKGNQTIVEVARSNNWNHLQWAVNRLAKKHASQWGADQRRNTRIEWELGAEDRARAERKKRRADKEAARRQADRQQREADRKARREAAELLEKKQQERARALSEGIEVARLHRYGEDEWLLKVYLLQKGERSYGQGKQYKGSYQKAVARLAELAKEHFGWELPTWQLPWECHRPVAIGERLYVYARPLPDIEQGPRYPELLAHNGDPRCRHFDCRRRAERGIYCEFHQPTERLPLPDLRPYEIREAEAIARAAEAGHEFGAWVHRYDPVQLKQREAHNLSVFGDRRTTYLGVPGCRWVRWLVMDSLGIEAGR